MTLKYLFQKMIKYKYIIIISLIVSFFIGAGVSLLFTDTQYRTTAKINLFKVSKCIAKSFDENYYYLFFSKFISAKNSAHNITNDYFLSPVIIKKVYDKITTEGAEIAFDSFRKGIILDERKNNEIIIMITIFDRKELSEKVMAYMLDEIKRAFNDETTKRIVSEIEHRNKKKILIREKIEKIDIRIENMRRKYRKADNSNEKDALQMELSQIIISKSILKKWNTDNNIQIDRLQQVVDFEFWKLYEKEIRYTERGIELRPQIIETGLTMLVVACLLWLILIYGIFVKDSINYKE